MSKRYTDEQLDLMLDSYFDRRPRHAFALRAEAEKRSDRYMKNMWLKAAAVCASAAVMAGAVFTVVQHSAATAKLEPTAENTLFLKAYAEDVSQGELGETPDYIKTGEMPETELIWGSFHDDNFWENYYFGLSLPEEEAVRDGRAVEGSRYPTLSRAIIPFRIYGDNIVSVSVTSEKGNSVMYSDCSLSNTPEYRDSVMDYLHLRDGERSLVKGFYLYGRNYADCPGVYYSDCTGELPLNEYVTFEWEIPEYIMYESSYAITEFSWENFPLDAERIDNIQAEVKAFLTDMTAEEMSDIFGDTLSVTAKYTDGSEKEMQMKLTIDEDHNYVVEYISK